MSPELIGIIVLGALFVAGAFYFLHTAAGSAKLAALESSVKGAVSQVQAQVSTAVADIKGHVTATAAANVPPPAPAAAPVAPQVIVVPQPTPAPAAPPVAPQALFPGYGIVAPPPAVAPVAPPPTAPALTPDTNNGVTTGVGGMAWGVEFGTANPTFPRSMTSASFTLPAGKYQVGGDNGLQDMTASLFLSFAPTFVLQGGASGLVLAADATGTATITAKAPCRATLQFHAIA